MLPDKWVPKDIPKPLAMGLIVVSLLTGLSGMRHGGTEGFLHTLENWLFMLVIVPCLVSLVAMPIKYRDNSFDVKLSYYLGMFVALLFMLSKLRYWH